MNDNKKYRCIECFSLFDDAQLKSDMLFCPSCDGHLQEGTFNESYTSEENKQQNQDESHLLFECISCYTKVRIVFPFRASSFRCPKCKYNYNIQTLSAPSPIYVIAPMAPCKQADEYARQPPEMPADVKKAMRLFEMDASASFAEIRAAYRKCMSEYHPDKVLHLGHDLRKLAEAKTTEYNLAFEIIQRYFQDC